MKLAATLRELQARPFFDDAEAERLASRLGVGAAFLAGLYAWAAEHAPEDCPPRSEQPLPALEAASYARLIQKGRNLFDHCIDQRSSACVVGFMEHELGKSWSAATVVIELLDLIQRKRRALGETDQEPDEDDAQEERMETCDDMIACGYGLLFASD